QQAVRRLLHELGVVAQGDLSVRANENEPPTRAVAQAVNEALTELRRRFGCIADASARLATACAEARMAGGEMLNASQRLAQKTAALGEVVSDAAPPALQASARATDCVEAAGQVHAAAAAASSALRRASTGLDAIRERMQATAQRVQRLSEASLQIGEAGARGGDGTGCEDALEAEAVIRSSACSDEHERALVARPPERKVSGTVDGAPGIDALVANLRADVREAAMALEDATARIVAQGILGHSAAAALARLAAGTRELLRHAAGVAAATSSQREALERVQAAMAEVARMTALATEASRASADRSAQLPALAHALARSVGRIRRSPP